MLPVPDTPAIPPVFTLLEPRFEKITSKSVTSEFETELFVIKPASAPKLVLFFPFSKVIFEFLIFKSDTDAFSSFDNKPMFVSFEPSKVRSKVTLLKAPSIFPVKALPPVRVLVIFPKSISLVIK